MSELIKRAVFGGIFVAVVLGCIFWSSLGLFLLLLTIGWIGVYEFLSLKKEKNIWVYIPLGITLTLLLTSASDIFPLELKTLSLPLAASLLFTFVVTVLLTKGLDSYSLISDSIFSLVYIALPLYLFFDYSTAETDYNFYRPLMVFLLVWSSDTFAYLAGRSLGKTPLFPTLSPKKTVEGFAGGTLLTGVLGMYLCWQWQLAHPMAGLFLGISIGFFGTAGDLFQSMLKRNAEVKDSGKIIPGHGGILDRFDAFLFAALVVWLWSQFI